MWKEIATNIITTEIKSLIFFCLIFVQIIAKFEEKKLGKWYSNNKIRKA